MAKINPKDLPDVREVITALCDRCLGSGQEVKVFKIDTNPDFTVQMSRDIQEKDLPTLFKYLQQYPFERQDDVFGERNFAQPIAYCYATEHSKDPELIKMRTEIVSRSIDAAKRNGVNDIGGYLKGSMDDMLHFWELQLLKLNIPKKYHDDMLNRVGSIRQEQRYLPISKPLQYCQIRGFDD